MHSVTSGAVAQTLGSTSSFLIPICLEYQETSSTEYVRYKMIGADFDSYFNDVLPNVSGKTKKVKFLISYGTQNQNHITVALKRRYDSNYTILVNNDVIWGGKGKEVYTKLYLTQELNQNVLDPYTDIVFKSDMSNYVSIIDYIFAYVYYD